MGIKIYISGNSGNKEVRYFIFIIFMLKIHNGLRKIDKSTTKTIHEIKELNKIF